MLEKLVVDIARYTKSVDPAPLHAASVQMVILKVDGQFPKNGKAFADSGMPIAVYHWIDPTINAEKQVENTLKIIRESGLPVLAIFADFEHWWADWGEWYDAIWKRIAWNSVRIVNPGKLSSHAKDVFKGLEESQMKIFGYTRASFVHEYAPSAANWMHKYRWWLAHYITCDVQILSWDAMKANILPLVDFSPALPPGVGKEKVVGHQFTGDKLSLPGLYGNPERTEYAKADVNLFDEQFLTEIGAIPQPKSLPKFIDQAIVTASPTLMVRSGPGVSYPILYKLLQGAPVQVVQLKNRWAKLRSYADEWCSAEYLQFATNINIDVDTETEAPEDVVEPGETTEDTLPTEELAPIEVEYPGVTYHKLRRYNADCHILVVDLAGKNIHVTPYTGMKTVSYVASNSNAAIVINGDGWGIAGYPNSIAASNGKVYQKKQFDLRPWINISRNNKISIDFRWQKWKKKLHNAVSGDRYIIDEYGKYNHKINAVNKDPRTAIGFTWDEKLLIIVADGRTPQSAGLSFRELGYLFEEFGAKMAINLDGGGSTALWLKDRIVNVPIDGGVPGQERLVVNHLCIFC